MHHLRTLFILIALGLLPTSAYAQEHAPTTVLVVRHAEKVISDNEDPPLTQLGAERARSLIEVAREAGVTTIYSTPFRRTRDTAAPLAEALGVAITTFPIEGSAAEHSAALARELLEEHAGETVLVVGHSNTVPDIVRALGGSAMESMTESEYDHLLIVVVPEQGAVRTIHARYGPPSGTP
ncbi:MAG TPA: phosphoglycerate mutase family protein [Longimicrobiaceae bacterium]|nr:phosphoglycerate mutase family protein [Longimicrobiaceae bacterium]